MFADPLIITTAWADQNRSIPRIDAGNQSGTYRKRSDTLEETLNVRHTSYLAKGTKKKVNRHNVELTRIVKTPGSNGAPATSDTVKVYIVLEHSDDSTVNNVLSAVIPVVSIFDGALNPGYVDKLLNNEG